MDVSERGSICCGSRIELGAWRELDEKCECDQWLVKDLHRLTNLRKRQTWTHKIVLLRHTLYQIYHQDGTFLVKSTEEDIQEERRPTNCPS